MNKFILNTVSISLISLSIVSCKKDKEHEEEHHDEPVTAVIDINSFNDGDTIASGATFHMSGTITGTSEMHGYTIVLHNHATMQDVFNVQNHDHSSVYTIHEHWVNNVADTSTVMFTLTTALDHNGGTMSTVKHVVCLP